MGHELAVELLRCKVVFQLENSIGTVDSGGVDSLWIDSQFFGSPFPDPLWVFWIRIGISQDRLPVFTDFLDRVILAIVVDPFKFHNVFNFFVVGTAVVPKVLLEVDVRVVGVVIELVPSLHI